MQRNGFGEEGIRSWYKRNTKKAVRALIGASVILILTAVLVWIFAPMAGLARAQTFNGALVIPGFGGLWIAAFMFIWLIPMREVSFRGQESMERMEAKLIGVIDANIRPAVDVWRRIGERIEQEIPALLREFRGAVDTLQRTAARIEKAVEKNEKVADEARPVLEALRRIETRFEAEIQTGMLDELREASRCVRRLAAPPPPPPPKDLPRVEFALAALGNAEGRRT